MTFFVSELSVWQKKKNFLNDDQNKNLYVTPAYLFTFQIFALTNKF
jgi:hypothetical protein